MMRLTEVVKNLLLINILFFLAQNLFDIDFLALRYPGSEDFLPVQLVTHFFMHGGTMHLFFNMFALYMFGPPLETRWGPQRFLLFYLLCAFGAVALHMGYMYWDLNATQTVIDQFAAAPSFETFRSAAKEVNPFFLDFALNTSADEFLTAAESAVMQGADTATIDQIREAMQQSLDLEKRLSRVVGASGAIYGLLLAFGMMFPNVKLMLIFLPIPIKAKYFIPIMMVIELFLGFQQFTWDNIAHFAHLGGALTGFLLVLYWRKNDNTYRQN